MAKTEENAVLEVWTVARVKAELPNVRVYNTQHREEAPAWVRGRLLPFARVSCPLFGGDYEFSWEAIAGALNAGRPLIV